MQQRQLPSGMTVVIIGCDFAHIGEGFLSLTQGPDIMKSR
jgi:hypothetical protein